MKFSLSRVVLLGILHNCIQATNQCSPPQNLSPQEPAQRAKRAQLVILGTVVRGPNTLNDVVWDTLYSATFRVHCVIKGQALPEYVNVSGFGSKSGLCVKSSALLNRTYVAFLKRTVRCSSDLSVHEVNTQEATIHLSHQSNNVTLRKIIGAVGTRNSSKHGYTVLHRHATKTASPCKSHCNHNHMKRRRSWSHKCRRRKRRLTTTRRPSTIAVEATFKSTADFSISQSSLATSPASARPGEEAELQALASARGSRTASHVTRRSWFVVLIFHSLVSLVVKYRQT